MKNLPYYLALPYTVIMRRDEDGDYVDRIDELPGCAAHGESPGEALEALEEAKQLWITDSLESGDPVPEPSAEESLPSGKWVQRVPKTLHKKLVSLAKRENVSLNQLVTSILSEAVGPRRADHYDCSYQAAPAAWGYNLMTASALCRIDTSRTIQFAHVAGTRGGGVYLVGEGISVAGSSRAEIPAITYTGTGHWITNQPPREEVAAHG